MLRRLLWLGVLFVSVVAASAAGPAARPVEPDRLVRLKNGLSVLVRRDERFPLVHASLYVHAGSAYETPAEAGISHQLEHMAFKGTTRRGPGEIARAVESVGGHLNAATSFDQTFYYVEVPDAHWAVALDIVTDMAFCTRIDPKELASEKKVVLSEIDRGEDQPDSRLFKTLQSMLWKGTTYEWPVIGYRRTVEAFTAEDIHAYIGRLYQPQSMLLVVTGKVDPDAVVAEVERLCGELPNTRLAAPPPQAPEPRTVPGPRVTVVPGKWNKVYLGLAFPLPDLKSSLNPVTDLLGQILGGDDTSRLYRTFKYKKRLVSEISVATMNLERAGMLYVHATLDADKLPKFWRELCLELSRLNPARFTAKELARARLNIENSLFLAKETLAGLTSKLAYFQFFENGQEAERTYLHSLARTERAEMAELYRRFVRPERLKACILVPEGTKVSAEELERSLDAAWPAKAGAEAHAAAEAGPRPEQKALPGGSALVLLPDQTLPYTALSIYWPGGDARLSRQQEGLAALAAKVVTRGTKRLSATEIEDFLSDRAASLAAEAGRDVFALDAKFPSRFSGDILPLVRDILTSPAFADTELDRARQDQAAQIKRGEDQPIGLMFRHVWPFLYASPPYGLYHLGQPGELARFTAGDVRSFWEAQARSPFVLAVCGQFDAAAVTEFAASLAKALAVRNAGPGFPAPDWGGLREKELKLPDRQQAHLLLVFQAPGREDRQASAGLSLLRAALAGQSGLLFRDMRDRQGLGYTVTSFLWQAKKTGFFAFYIGTEPDKLAQAKAGFEQAVAALEAGPLPAEELARAKNILRGEYYQEHQSLLSRSREAASLVVRGFPRGYEQEVIELAQGLSAEDIRQLAEKTLDWERAYTLRIVP
jgi:zinc protease